MPDKLKAAVIGLGMGRYHVRGLTDHDETEVVAVVDLDEKRCDSVCKEFNVPKNYQDVDEMLKTETPDIVAIATPNFLHAPFTIKALEAGAHVLCEKPMAMNAEDAQKMADVAEKEGKTLMINFSYRFSDISFALKEQVDKGKIGDIYFARTVWHRRRGFPGFGGWFGQKDKSGGGPLIDLGVHRIDLALWLMGNPAPLSVNGATYNKLVSEIIKETGESYDCEDLAVAMVRLEGGITMLVEISWGLHGKNNESMRTEIYGTKGSIVQRNVNQGYQFEGWLYTEENGALYDQKLARTLVKAPTVHQNLVDVIKGRNVINYAHASTGVHIQKILDGIYKSAETGKEEIM